MSDDFESLIERRRKDESRVHTDLTEPFKERVMQILEPVGYTNQRDAFYVLFEKIGYSPLRDAICPNNEDPRDVLDAVHGSGTRAQNRLIRQGDTVLILSYLERLLREVWHERDSELAEQIALKIQRTLKSEGILWELEQGEPGELRFEEMGSEMMQEADDELRSLALGDTWEEPLRGYNEAYELYLDRKYGKEIPEKLYNSIEAVVTTICVDLEGWEGSKERNLKYYLDVLREEEVFAPNPIMKAEVGDLVNSMEKAFSKAGNDRKNRHELIDRRYCTLMLHQVSAYLVFIIKRYEDEYGP